MFRACPNVRNSFSAQFLNLNRFWNVEKAFASALETKFRGLGLCSRWLQRGPDQLALGTSAKGPNTEQM